MSYFFRKLLFVCPMLAWTAIAIAQQNVLSAHVQLGSFLLQEMKKEQIPGLAYAVLVDGRVVDTGAYGLADLELRSPVTTHTVFPVGSLGKTFTATAILLLQQQGKLSIEDPISRYFDSLPESWTHITIKNLLSHTSGIKDYLNNFPGYPAIEEDNARNEITPAEFLSMVEKYPLNFPPGENFAYCNSGYALLGFIVQKASGLPLDAFLHQNVFVPLGMDETQYVNNEQIIRNRARGYRISEKGTPENGMFISDFYSSLGDMGVMTSISDMLKWSRAINEGKIVSHQLLQLMWTPSRLNDGRMALNVFSSYGLGWEITDYRGFRLIGHTGSFGSGYSSDFVEFPEKKRNIILLTNLNSTQTRTIVYHIAGSFFPGLAALDQTRSDIPAKPFFLGKADTFFKWLNGESSDTSITTTTFRQNVNPVLKLVFTHPSGTKLPLNFIGVDTLAHQLQCFGATVKRIAYYRIRVMNQDHYMALYLTADNMVADFKGY